MMIKIKDFIKIINPEEEIWIRDDYASADECEVFIGSVNSFIEEKDILTCYKEVFEREIEQINIIQICNTSMADYLIDNKNNDKNNNVFEIWLKKEKRNE